jgi:Molecular chaperone GrpE (heat shock protein)
MLKFTSVALYCVLLSASSIEGFTVSNTPHSHIIPRSGVRSATTSRVVVSPSYSSCSSFSLNLSQNSDASDSSDSGAKEDGANDDDEDDHETSQPDERRDETASQGDEATTEATEASVEETAVDEEMEAIKKEIANLESQLKAKNRELDGIEKMAEQYTKGGYARKVAEMEQIKKTKTAASADNKVTARASVLKTFLPVVDELNMLSEKYKEDEFASKYSALAREFNGALMDLGVAEYAIAEGDLVNTSRATVVREEHSDSVAKGCVIEALTSGYELGENVMRKAEVVASLGAEVQDAEDVSEAGSDEKNSENDEK